MRISQLFLVTILAAGIANTAFAQTETAQKKKKKRAAVTPAQKIINHAIEAKGGRKALAKTMYGILEDSGTYYGAGMELPYNGRYVYDHKKKRFRMEIVDIFTSVAEMKKAWTSMAGEVKDLEEEALTAAKEELMIGYAMSLLPLRRPNDRFQLSLAGTEEVEGETCDGVKVTHKQMPDLTIFVSRKTGLIKKSTYMTRMAEKQFEKVKDETIYHSYKEFDGIKLPASMTVHRDGEKFVVSKTNKVTFPKSLDEDEFAKP